MKRFALMMAMCIALLASGCGGGEDSPSGDGASVGDGSPSTEASSTEPVASKNRVEKGIKPPIEAPNGRPPTKLIVTDMIKGKGAVAKKDDEVTVQFVALRWNGEPFQSSWDTGKFEDFTFQLNSDPHQVIPGWEKGVPGMRVGGRRELVVPPRLIYWPEQRNPDIPLTSEASLVYVVDLLDVR